MNPRIQTFLKILNEMAESLSGVPGMERFQRGLVNLIEEITIEAKAEAGTGISAADSAVN